MWGLEIGGGDGDKGRPDDRRQGRQEKPAATNSSAESGVATDADMGGGGRRCADDFIGGEE